MSAARMLGRLPAEEAPSAFGPVRDTASKHDPAASGRHSHRTHLIDDVLRSPGEPLDTATRATMESRFRHDFSKVRVHTSARADESARSINALAYTVGRDIVFAAGHRASADRAHVHLLAHELAHVVQQRERAPTTREANAPSSDAEREADAVARQVEAGETPVTQISWQPPALYRQPAPGASAAPAANAANAGEMTRAEFESVMKRKFGVKRFVTGTKVQQVEDISSRGGAPRGGIDLPNWRAWDPGAASPVYATIVESCGDFNREIGGVPIIDEILFFDTSYALEAGVAVARPDEGASYGAGQLTIYRAGVNAKKALPIARSNAKGNYPPVGFAVAGIPGQTPGAPLPLPSEDQSTRRIITHELGHGLAEAALGPNPTDALDPTMLTDFQRAVGWTAGNPPRLFDVTNPAVAAALASGKEPPSNAEITPANWNSPKWGEQPLTNYSVTGGPPEDFAEAAMAFVEAPELLKSRSPHRFRFLEERKSRWLPKLRKIPPVGDFPAPSKDKATA
ncbi:DUF4157 domain-containing protein [Paraburkholderia sp. SIMBA_049]